METFKFSTDPELEAKVRDVVGLYLAPPADAVVVSVDEKSQIQALDRTQPMLPLRRACPRGRTHDYIRHGTTTLFAALEVATGKITADACYPRHTNVEFLAFLKQVAKAHPRVKLHVICDNYATHNHPNVKAWLAKNPRITLHFTPTSCSWLNMVEIFFGIITRQAIRRGTFTGVTDLKTPSAASSTAYNERANPSPGPKPQTNSSPRSTVNRLKHATLARRLAPTTHRRLGADDAVGLQRGELVGGEAESHADLGVVLAEQRRRPAVERAGPSGQAERERRVRGRPCTGCSTCSKNRGRRSCGNSSWSHGCNTATDARRPQRVDDLGACGPRHHAASSASRSSWRAIARRWWRAPRSAPTPGAERVAQRRPLLVGGDGDRHPAVAAEVVVPAAR